MAFKAPHWAVLVPLRALQRRETRYHEWGSIGKTACGRRYRNPETMRHAREEEVMAWVQRGQAEKFAEPCKRCAAASPAKEQRR